MLKFYITILRIISLGATHGKDKRLYNVYYEWQKCLQKLKIWIIKTQLFYGTLFIENYWTVFLKVFL